MAKKKSTKKTKTPKKSKKVVKSTKKGRKINRYNAIRSIASKYCKEKYGRVCTNDELNTIYRRLKKSHNKVDINDVIREFNTLLGKKNLDDTPEDLETFMWWDSEALIFQNNQFFFKEDDTLVFNLDDIEMQNVSSKFRNFPSKYREKMYRGLRRRTEWIEGEIGEGIYPQFKLNDEKTDVKKRIFVWDLDLGIDPALIDFTDYIDTEEERPSRPPKPAPKPSEKPSKPKEEAQPKTDSKDILKALEMLKEDYKEGIYTKEEYKEEAKELRRKLNKGGLV